MAAPTNHADNRKQLQSQTYRLAALDQDFILGEAASVMRFSTTSRLSMTSVCGLEAAS